MRFLLIILFSIFAILTGKQFFVVLLDVFTHIKHYWYALCGVCVYLVFILFFKRKNLVYWQTYTHEMAHKLVGLMFFRKIASFKVTSDKGGEVEYYGERNIFITLAPYCFPYYTLFLVVINQFIEKQSTWIFDIIIAFTLSFFVHTIVVDARPFQPDIKRNGYILSYLFIATFNFLFLGIILLSYRFSLLKAIEFFFEDIYKNIILYINN